MNAATRGGMGEESCARTRTRNSKRRISSSRGGYIAVPGYYVEEVTRSPRPRGPEKNEDIPWSVGGYPPGRTPKRGSGFGYIESHRGREKFGQRAYEAEPTGIPILESVTR